MTTTSTTTSPTSKLLVATRPSLSLGSPHKSDVTGLVALPSSHYPFCSFISYSSSDGTAKRWSISSSDNTRNKQTIRLVGTVEFPRDEKLYSVMGKDKETLLTVTQASIRGRAKGGLKVWNTKSLVCLHSLLNCRDTSVRCLILTRDKTIVVCGSTTGVIEKRRASDLRFIQSFQPHCGAVTCICELSDGSLVSGSEDTYVCRWSEDGKATNFSGHSKSISAIIELKEGVIVSAAADNSFKMWNVSTGECLRTVTLPWFPTGPFQPIQPRLVALPLERFASGAQDGVIRVWDANGESLQTIQTAYRIDAMMRLGYAIVTTSKHQIEIRLLK